MKRTIPTIPLKATKAWFLILLLWQGFNASAQINQSAQLDESFSQMGTFSGSIKCVITLPDNKIMIGGTFNHYKDRIVNNNARLNANGSQDTTYNSDTEFDFSTQCMALQADGKIIVGGFHTNFTGANRKGIARLNTDGSLDMTFNPGSGFNNTVNSVALQTDGKIIMGGEFASINGTSRNRIARLNADGSLDLTFNPGSGFNGYVSSIVLQADGKMIVGGSFTSFNGTNRNRIARLNTNGSLDLTFNPGSGFDDIASSIALQADGKITVGGHFASFNGTNRNYIARLNNNGSLDLTFNPGSGFNSSVYSIALQVDGKIIAGGNFTNFNGTSRNKIARLNTDGSLDLGFNTEYVSTVNYIALQADGKIIVTGAYIGKNIVRFNSDGSSDIFFNQEGMVGFNSNVCSTAMQADGKIFVAGYFTGFSGTSRNRIARLNSDGSLDMTFNPGSGFNNTVRSIIQQMDGKIIVGGDFSNFNGTSRNNIARLNIDGSLDVTFNPGSGFNNRVRSITQQMDGKIIVGGDFSNFNGTSRNCIARLNTDGSLDMTYDPGSGFGNIWVGSMSLQADGKIIVGGNFTSFNGTNRNRIARLNADGSLDMTFNPGSGFNDYASSIALQTDGKIIVGGNFTSFNGTSRNYIARLNADGSLDMTYNLGSGFSSYVYSIAMQADGKIIVGGRFTTFNGTNRNRIARLNTDGSLDLTFNPSSGFNSAGFNSPESIVIQTDGKIILGGKFDVYNDKVYYNMVRLKGDQHYNTIKGKVYTDANQDCQAQMGEKKLASVVVKAEPGPFFGGTNAFGEYQLRVDSGTAVYTLSQQLNPLYQKLLVNQCAISHTVNTSGVNNEFGEYNFADSVKSCALLNVIIEQNRMRRCFRSSAHIYYQNHGNAFASGAKLTVELPPYIVPISSTPAWSAQNGSILTYNLGTIAAGAGGFITLIDSVICGNENIRGLTQCLKASITPASHCETENPSWDKSSIKVTGSCQGDSMRFIILNSGSGNMLSSQPYRVYKNDTLIFSSTFQLNSGMQFILTYPANGHTLRVEADQHPLHPGKSKPRATLEDCSSLTFGNAMAREMVMTAPQDDADEETAITCGLILDSYDPNDKQAQPVGTGTQDQIAPGQALNYTIRFQNTGTDTAYTVIVVDTLDAGLDVASFIEGVSSHPYTLSISGKGKAVLTWTFRNINLPDSTTNQAGSNGFVTFRINVPANAALGNTIHNKGHIFFDYNSAIITNETMHTVGINVPEDLSEGAKVGVGAITTHLSGPTQVQQLKVYPNPTSGLLHLELYQTGKDRKLVVLSPLGTMLKSFDLSNETQQQVNLEGLSNGVYYYELRQLGERQAGGMIQVY